MQIIRRRGGGPEYKGENICHLVLFLYLALQFLWNETYSNVVPGTDDPCIYNYTINTTRLWAIRVATQTMLSKFTSDLELIDLTNCRQTALNSVLPPRLDICP